MSRDAQAVAPFGAATLLITATLVQTAFSSISQGVPVLAVFFRQEMHLSLAQMGTLLSAGYLGRILGLTVTGLIIDRVGPRTVQGWGTALIAVFTAMMIALHTYPALLGGLFLIGLTLSTGTSSGTRSVFDVFPAERRGLAMGVRHAGMPMGGAIGAAVIPPVLAAYGIIDIWAGMAAVAAVAGTLFTLAAPSLRRPAGRRAGFGASFRGLRSVARPWLMAFLMASGQAGAIGFVIVDLETRHGWPLALAGLGLAAAQIGGGAGRVGTGWLSDRLGGRRPEIVAGAGLLGAAAALLIGWLPPATPVAAMIPVLFMLGVGAIGWTSTAMTWAGERIGPSRSGQAMTWTSSVVSLAVVVDTPIFGRFVDLTHHFSIAWTAVGVLMVAAAAIGVLGRRREGALPAAAATAP